MMFVLSNNSKLYGAAALLDEKIMSDISYKFGEVYILPSSVHETLIVPKRDGMELSELETMVREVNSTQVAEHEQLSDYVYAYDVVTHELYSADKEAERQAAKETVKVDITDIQKDIKVPKKKPSVLGKLAESKEKAAVMAKVAPPRDMGIKRGAASLA